MSEENVEIVRRALEAQQRGEPWAEFLDPEMEWDFSAFPGLDVPVRGGGREGFLRLMDRYWRAWIGYEAAVQEVIDAGDDVVLVLQETARARGTEIPVERNIHQVVTIREGRATRLRVYGTRQEALEAAGLSE